MSRAVTPNFIIAGTFPSGTGHLYGLLDQHSDVYLAKPMAPECNFFCKTSEYQKGIPYYIEKYFSGWNGEKAVGERSSLLFSSSDGISRLHESYPKIRIIILLRNPIDRAFANYRFTVLAGFEEHSFEVALELENERLKKLDSPFWSEIKPHAYFTRGLYSKSLRQLKDLFPSDQLLVIRSDSLIHSQKEVLGTIFSFLGVDSSENVSDFSDCSTPSVIDRKQQVELRKRFGADLDKSIQNFREGNVPRTDCDRLLWSNICDTKEAINPQTRKILAEAYSKEFVSIKNLVEFDTSDWSKN